MELSATVAFRGPPTRMAAKMRINTVKPTKNKPARKPSKNFFIRLPSVYAREREAGNVGEILAVQGPERNAARDGVSGDGDVHLSPPGTAQFTVNVRRYCRFGKTKRDGRFGWKQFILVVELFDQTGAAQPLE